MPCHAVECRMKNNILYNTALFQTVLWYYSNIISYTAVDVVPVLVSIYIVLLYISIADYSSKYHSYR